MIEIDELFTTKPSIKKDPKKYVEVTPKVCSNCEGRGIIDKQGEPDIGWGHSETCAKCKGTGKHD